MNKKIRKKISKYIAELRKNRRLIIVVFTLFIIFDSVIISTRTDITLFSFLALYVLGISLLKITSKATFFISLFCAVIMSLAYIVSGTSVITEKASVWLYLFLIVGIVQLWRE